MKMNTLTLILSYFILISGAIGAVLLCVMVADMLVSLLGGPSAVSYSQEVDDDPFSDSGNPVRLNTETGLMSRGAGNGRPFQIK
jgi:hypothetical protein